MPRVKDEPVLFLDIDGVLVSADHIQRGGTSDDFDSQAVAELQRVVDETGCVIVLSSIWRLCYSLAYMRGQLIAAGMRSPCPLIDSTPDLYTRGAERSPPRGEEVKAWIESRGFTGRYVCVDDDADFLPEQPLVRTTWQKGFTKEHADECIRILRGARSDEEQVA